MKISILIPCYNEESSIESCLNSCIDQTRKADEIIVVDDSSTDNTPNILRAFNGRDNIKVVKTPYNTGNKSFAQEYGLQFITGDFFIATDGDSLLDRNFVREMEKYMYDESTTAISGYVKSIKYNWLTACRALDYIIGQNIDKPAQSLLNYIYVIPGVAGAFRTDVFKKEIIFNHDTITEDLDFTYRLHELNYKILFNKNAICYTQDPYNMHSYINQMRRWIGGGWQNLIKHLSLPQKPGMALELSLIYVEGLIYSVLMFLIPLVNPYFTLILFFIYFGIIFSFGVYGAIKEKRPELLFAFPTYLFLKYVNAWIFIEQFFKEVVFRNKGLVWLKADRMQVPAKPE